jgi:septum formation protein
VAASGPRLLLASASPRRHELLARLGLPFDVRAADLDETPLPDEEPRSYVARLAAAKAQAVAGAASEPEVVAIGADTAVVVDGHLLGKPVDDADAARMLRMLSGRTHQVLTGVAVAVAGPPSVQVDVAVTEVTFASLSDDDIAWYVASGEPVDKAGAYAVQGRGAVYVTSISGSPDNVVGLPLALTRRLLEAAGHPGLGSVSRPS